MSIPKTKGKPGPDKFQETISIDNVDKEFSKDQIETLKKKITPLYKDPYKFQLEYKYKHVRNNLGKLTKKIYFHAVSRGLEPPCWCTNKDKLSEIEQERRNKSHSDCNIDFAEIPLKPILSTINCNWSHKDDNHYSFCKTEEGNKDPGSTNPYSYRNKCEFTIGFTAGESVGVDAEISVGFVSHINRFEPIVIGVAGQSNEDEETGQKSESQENACDYTCKVSKSDSCINKVKQEIEIIHPCVLDIVKITEKMVKKSSADNNYKVYSRRNRTGVWRLLLVRISETHKEIMITLQTTKLTNIQDKNSIVNLLINYLSEESAIEKKNVSLMNFKVSSLYLHQSNSIVDTFENGELELVWGKPEITFNICNTNLSVGPLSFFQTNTKGCQVLYEAIKEVVFNNYLKYVTETNNEKKPSNLLILDICCGAGAIGITILNAFRKLINNNNHVYVKNMHLYGVDCCEEAINSAKRNAANNSIMNAKYVYGTAENVVPDLLSKLSLEESYIVAIIDPPRSGLHTNLLKFLRDFTGIQNLIYVSCNIESLIKNCLDLCSSYDPMYDNKKTSLNNKEKKYGYLSVFEPVFAIPVDMFPHTKHVETVLYLSRNSRNTQHNISKTKKQRTMKNPLLA
ncbi:TrmA RNA methylase [Cryptosporidium ryanae]|uniref:TrmA RNA methylase n=1 Tax=Cryptosporidium ryanae TaxID=515981 RepID=UPI00351A5F22|nr:TrmA RNA methylase [Cryptosporidium ryanae]